MALKDFLKDFMDAFAEAYKYAELDFYKLRNEIIALLNKARAKGYNFPDYCELQIKVTNKFQTDVSIEAYYKVNGKYYRFKKVLDVGELTRIPVVIKNELTTRREVSVKLADFQSLYTVQDWEIVPTGDFKRLQMFTFKGNAQTPASKELLIKDCLFYYEVVCTYVYSDGSRESRRKYYASIANLPKDIKNTIVCSDDHICLLNVE